MVYSSARFLLTPEISRELLVTVKLSRAGLAAACSSGVADAYKACRRQSHRASF